MDIIPTKPTGDGTAESPYQIGTKEELYWFAGLVNGTLTDGTEQNTSANAVLTDNITVNEGVLKADGTLNASGSFTSWTPIGDSSNTYAGTFDGNGYTISGLYFNSPNTGYVGLFGQIENGYDDEGNQIYGKISGVGIVDSYFNGNNYVGAVCGYNNQGTIENCHNEGCVIGSSYVGGLCGWNERGTIINCYNSGEIKESSAIMGTFIAGGICGQNVGTIENCHNKGEVSPSNYAGGICGWNGKTVINCYNTGAISATRNNAYVGGVSGNHSGYIIANCYNIGTVNGTGDNVGGVCGVKNSASIVNCYYLANKADENGGRTSAQFKRGEVAYMLSQGCEKYGTNFDGSIWGQNIGTEDYPLFGGAKVYSTSPCLCYTNNPDETVKEHPKYINGFCPDCGIYGPAEQNEDGYYEISNAGELLWFEEFVNSGNTEANAILTDDITLNSNLLSSLEYDAEGNIINGDSFTAWTPIGNSSNGYTGTFDGNGKTISGLFFNNNTTDYVGLFGYNSGTIKNVGVIDSYFKGRQYVGGVCGKNYDGNIEDCHNIGAVVGNGNNVGGVCGYNNGEYAKITNCYNTGEISGTNSVGGVCGENFDGTIEDCHNIGAVVGNGNNVGGVCGYSNSEYTKITNCYNTGEISGTNSVGGVCGYSNSGEITGCYNTGNVSGSDKVGGVCGNNYDGIIKDCHNIGAVVGNGNYVGGVCGFNDIIGTIKNCYNTGKVSGSNNVGGVCGYNEFKIINCYFNSNKYSGDAVGCNEGTVTDVAGKTTAQFKSGEVAYLLNGSTSEGTLAWGQTIGTDLYPVLGGSKVYQVDVIIDCSTVPHTSYSNTDASISSDHDYTSGGVCRYCNKLENENDGFYSASLTLTDGVILNYYMFLESTALADENAYIHFTSANGINKKIMLSDGVLVDGKYKFSLELRPDQMADEITAKVVYSDGSKGSGVDYSVQMYAENVAGNDNSKELVDAMLNFGAYTQLYTGKNTENLATPVEDYTSNANIGNEYIYTLENGAEGISVKSATLLIGANTTIKIKYVFDDGADINAYTFGCVGNEIETEVSGNVCYVYLKNIRPENLDEMYSFTVSDGTNTTTFNYSAFTYMRTVLENTEYYDQNLINLMNAMYDYNQAANAYSNNE